jgi:hypothetical protein
MSNKRDKIPLSEQFNILSAAWILACIDKSPIMTYRGIQHRLRLDEYDIESIKSLIQSRGELFRRRVPRSYFTQWIGDMRGGKHIPSWIREDERAKRADLINSLQLEDVFISQFRVNDEELRYESGFDTGIIDWGLQHIERLRKARFESREESIKKWQLWILLFFSFASLVLSIINLLR